MSKTKWDDAEEHTINNFYEIDNRDNSLTECWSRKHNFGKGRKLAMGWSYKRYICNTNRNQMVSTECVSISVSDVPISEGSLH